MNFTEHIPPSILKNPNAAKFAQVLDGLDFARKEQLAVMEHSYDPRLNKEPHSQRRFMYEMGQFPWYSFVEDKQREIAIMQAIEIWGEKGSTPGLQLFLSCVDSVLISSDFTRWWPPALFIPGDPVFGVFPDEAAVVVALTNPTEYPFLHAGSFSYYYNTVILNITCGLMDDTDKRKEFTRTLPLFLAMVTPGSCNLTVNFFDNNDHNNLIETLNL
jgi:hypothetical protein